MNVLYYVVTVKAMVERVEKTGKQWERVSALPDSEYAYTPEIDRVVQREMEMFEQRVEHLSLPALVAVVNDLPAPALKVGAKDRL